MASTNMWALKQPLKGDRAKKTGFKNWYWNKISTHILLFLFLIFSWDDLPYRMIIILPFFYQEDGDLPYVEPFFGMSNNTLKNQTFDRLSHR